MKVSALPPAASPERTNAARHTPIAAWAAAVGWNDSWASAPLNYMGVHIVDPRPIYARPETAFGLFPLWARWAAEGRLTGTLMEGDWMHVGDPEALRVAEARLAR